MALGRHSPPNYASNERGKSTAPQNPHARARQESSSTRQVELAQALGVGEHVDLDDLAVGDREAGDRERPPSRATTKPAAPLTSAGRANAASRAKLSARSATASRAPDLPRRAARGRRRDRRAARRRGRAPRRAPRSRPPRAAARKASTTSRWRGEVGVGRRRRRPGRAGARGSRAGAPRPASGPTIGAISSNGTANMSCSTNASRSAGCSVSSTTSSARPTESASSASCSGSTPSSRLTIGSGTWGPSGSSRARLARAQHVEADARDDGRQPAAEVLDAARVGAAEAQPGLLHGVVGLAHRAEHPVGHRAQVGPVGLELLRQVVALVHSSHPFVAFRHSSDEPNRRRCDKETTPMERKWWTLLAVSVATFMLLLDITVVNVALPSIREDLGASFTDLQWVVDAYALTLAALVLTAGSLADRLGRRARVRRRARRSSPSPRCSARWRRTRPSSTSRARSRASAARSMFAVSLALIAQEFPAGRERGMAMGIYGATIGVAVAIGPLVGGALTDCARLGVDLLPQRADRARRDRHHLPEAAREPRPERDARRLGRRRDVQRRAVPARARARARQRRGLGQHADRLAVRRRRRRCSPRSSRSSAASREPMLPLGLFKRPAFTGVQLAAFAVSGSMFALFLYLTLYLQNYLGYSPFEAGVRYLPITIASFIAAPIAGALLSRVQARLMMSVGLAGAGVGLLLMSGIEAGDEWTTLLGGFLVAGAGVGLLNPVIADVAVSVVPKEQSGMAAGINDTFRQVGVAVGIAVLGRDLRRPRRRQGRRADRRHAGRRRRPPARARRGRLVGQPRPGARRGVPPGARETVAERRPRGLPRRAQRRADARRAAQLRRRRARPVARPRARHRARAGRAAARAGSRAGAGGGRRLRAPRLQPPPEPRDDGQRTTGCRDESQDGPSPMGLDASPSSTGVDVLDAWDASVGTKAVPRGSHVRIGGGI